MPITLNEPQNILITGGSGLIGTTLTNLLIGKGYSVSHLGRKNQSIPNVKSFQWDINKGSIDIKAIENTDCIIHLAGSNIAGKRWNKDTKREILESRTKSAELLFNTLKNTPNKVKTIISASGSHYYGDSGNTWMNEESPKGNLFLSDVCKEWEESAKKFSSLNKRVVILRFGVVLSDKGGALKPMANAVKFFVGSPLGSGNQYLSWIHINDLCSIFQMEIEDENMQGTYNATAPNPATNKEFMQTIGKVLHRPIYPFHVPSFILKMLFGEMSSVLLTGNRASSNKLINQGFTFQFPELKAALENILIK